MSTSLGTSAQDARASQHGADARVLRRARLLLIGVYVVAVVVYVLLGRGQPIPQVTPDEFLYSTLARSVAAGHGLTWNGGSQGLNAALWVYLIAPAWAVTNSIVTSYALAKGIAAVVGCLVVFPTWWLARRFVSPLMALAPAILAVAGTWMAHTGQLVTENLALPAAAASFSFLVVALVQPRPRWGWLALALAFIATWARLQMGVLIPIIFLVLATDVAIHRRQWRERASRNRALLLVTGILSVVGAGSILIDPSLLGFYDIVSGSLSLAGVPGALGKQALGYVAMSGFLPVLIVLAASSSRTAWRDASFRALLLTYWIATIVFVVQTAYTLPKLGGISWNIQRYVEYTLPLLFVAMTVGLARTYVRGRALALWTVVVALSMLFMPAVKNIQEQRAIFGIDRRFEEALGTSTGVALALATAFCGAAALVALALARRSSRQSSFLVAAAVLILGAVFLVQDQKSWSWQRVQSQVWRDEGFPRDLSWIDDAAKAPVARLVGVLNPFRAEATEFFNRSVTQVYVPNGPVIGKSVQGKTCVWGPGPSGQLVLSPGCGPTPKRFLLNDDLAKLTFYDQRVIRTEPNVGRVVEVVAQPPARPRLKAAIRPDCSAPLPTQDERTGEIKPSRAGCYGSVGGQLWLDAPATVRLKIRGGSVPHQVQVASTSGSAPRDVLLPPNKTTTVSIPLEAGTQQFQVRYDVDSGLSTPEIPRLSSVELVQDGRTEQLLY